MIHQLRIARPTSDLTRARVMYCHGLDLQMLGNFENHAGFDGVMLGREGLPWHIEFTHCSAHPITPTPTPEDLLVFYLPASDEWDAASARMLAAGFRTTSSLNPYWESRGRTFEDPDGYRVVLQNDVWANTAMP